MTSAVQQIQDQIDEVEDAISDGIESDYEGLAAYRDGLERALELLTESPTWGHRMTGHHDPNCTTFGQHRPDECGAP